MTKIISRTLVIVIALMVANVANAAPMKARRIDIQYVPPTNPSHQPIFQLLKERRVLEGLREFLSPFRLPRRLLLKTEGCDGVSNAWYDGEDVTVCYEYLDEVWKNASPATTPARVAPIDTLTGPTVDVFLHEVAHALFDLLKVPILGREEDAADQVSAYIMLQLGQEEARRLILGNAYQYKIDLQSSTVTMGMREFANEHGTPHQRFFGVLCIAYGANEELFRDFVTNGYLPEDRAESCKEEYTQVAYAFDKLIRPFIDKRVVRKLRKTWLPPIHSPLPRRPEGAHLRSE